MNYCCMEKFFNTPFSNKFSKSQWKKNLQVTLETTEGKKKNTEAEKRRRKIDEQTTNDTSHRQEVESYCDVSR